MEQIKAASVAAGQNPRSSSDAAAPLVRVHGVQDKDATLTVERATSSGAVSAEGIAAGYPDSTDEEQKRVDFKSKTANKNIPGGGEPRTAVSVSFGAGIDPQQRKKQTPYSSLTIQLWGKRAIGGVRRDLLGTAVISTQDMEQPSGDVCLPLGNNIVSAPDTVDTTTGALRRDRKKDTADEERRVDADDNTPRRKTSEQPVAGTAPVGEDKGKGNSAVWGSGLLKAFSRSKAGVRQESNVSSTHLPTGSIHVWLGKVRGGSSRGREPGRGRVVLRVHSAAGLRKVSNSCRRPTREM